MRAICRSLLLLLSACPLPALAAGDYAALVQLAQEWRDFERPAVSHCVPDYTAAAMSAKAAGLLAWRARLAGIDALIGQAENSNPGYNQGLKGFARRYGANYGDNFSGNFFGNAVLPSLLHQDPRYFRLGHGSIVHRALYSISTSVRTYGDNGKWQPAYSNLTGNLIGASISNLYYPDGDRGIYPTLRRALSITYQGTFGGLLQEFYPDAVQKYKNHKARKAAAASSADGVTPIPPTPTTNP